MKLKQLFENTQPPMTDQEIKQEALALLAKHFPEFSHPLSFTRVNVDSQGRISLDRLVGKMDYVPLQLDLVGSFEITGLKNLNNLPLQVLHRMVFQDAEIQNLSTASPVTLDSDTRVEFISCPNLTSLKGLENFKVEGGEKIRLVYIYDCPNLAIDLFDYRNFVKEFIFWNRIPRNVKLVRATTATNMIKIDLDINYDFINKNLANIINKYQGQGRGAALKMANELRAAELEHHVDWVQ
jgi:hypothetical protein